MYLQPFYNINKNITTFHNLIIYRNFKYGQKKHYDGLFILRRENGIGYPYLRNKLPPRSTIEWKFFPPPKLNQDQKKPNEFPVLLTKNVEGVGKIGDVVEVHRRYYRYFLLENKAAIPLTKYSDIPQSVLDRLSIKKPEINSPDTDKLAYDKAVSILTSGININFDPMAKWIITPFHLAKIVEIRTGFNVKPHHFQMETHEIRTTGTHLVKFKHENGMDLIIPIHISIIHDNN